MEIFRVRLNCIDHYQAAPTDLDPELFPDETAQYKVPIIRIFGATETGQKVCAHVHGFFPYLYVDYNASLALDDVEAFISRFRLSVDHALAVSYRRDQQRARAVFVAHVTLVKGVPFYGYHVGYRPYLKVYLLNPLHITRLADLLRQGAVMGKVIQPYESHMQYIPQWMTDYNLYGCSYLDCKVVQFREPVPHVDMIDHERHPWHSLNIPKYAIENSSKFPRQSYCALEIDVCVQNILNRLSVTERTLHQDFQEAMHTPQYREKLLPSMEGLWRDESRRRRVRMGLLDPDSSPFEPEVLVNVSAEPRENSGEWIHEDEYRRQVLQVAAREMQIAGRTEIAFDDFSLDSEQINHLPSAFESVEDLFPVKLRDHLSSQSDSNFIQSRAESDSQIQVDEGRIRSFGDFSELDELDILSDPEIKQSPPKTSTKPPVKGILHDELRTGDEDLARFGIRPAGDYSHVDEDAFEIPREYLTGIASTLSTGTGQKRSLTPNLSNSKKRSRVTFEERNASPLKDSSPEILAFCTPDSKTSSATPDDDHFKKAMQQVATQVTSRLSFPVVKDPNHSMTLTRLSHQSQDEGTRGDESPFKNTWTPDRDIESFAHVSEQWPSSQSSSDFSKIPPSAQPQGHFTRKSRQLQGFGVELLCFDIEAPSRTDVNQYLDAPGSVAQMYKAPHYSKHLDVPERKFQYGGLEYFPGSYQTPYLPEFDPLSDSLLHAVDQPMQLPDHKADENIYKQCRQICTQKFWEIEELPPSRQEVDDWLGTVQDDSRCRSLATSTNSKVLPASTQILPSTQINDGARYFHGSNEERNTSVRHETQYMSVMSLEIHVTTRKELVPNPENDEIAAVFWSLQDDSELVGPSGKREPRHGIVVSSTTETIGTQVKKMVGGSVDEEECELDLINRVVDVVRELDPDIITGFQVHDGSWGYIIERARFKFERNLSDEFSRVISDSHSRFGRDDRWGFNQTSIIRLAGRHTINIWRAMRAEINLLQYTMENIVFHLFRRRIPHYSFADLTKWWTSGKASDIAKVVSYFSERTRLNLEILEKNDLVPRTSEQARLLGVDFYSVFARGSQFKVESLMFRIAKPENFILVSPSRKQVGEQNALECLPLVMEPHSAFYSSPMVVLDFQSLYPSVMIAYNYCYSTFLGRIVDWRGNNKMGFQNYDRQALLLELLKDYINIAPNGMMYCKPSVRKSLLAKMLGEILETRVMVKSGMKQDKDDIMLQRLLNNRQLALKFIANVTYGYTSASFSGRMPCSEIADSIVQTGRETLEKAIMLIHSVERWGAEVVYGDTDSLFVHLKGKTKDQAFTIGQEIADSITAVNPKPVKLKFEKVYHPCVLLAKKRYVGFKYETRQQEQPEFDAKGIETVRRDGTPAEQRIEENALKMLFRTQDLSKIKQYFQAQCKKIMRGNVSIQDFCFAKEVKLGTYSHKATPTPGALISTRKMLNDPRAEPQYGERVPYVVITGAPGSRLIDRCVAPEKLLSSPHLELDANYYINKNLIPPLQRIFNLVGGNVRQWYDEMPKLKRVRSVPIGLGSKTGAGRNLIENYLRRTTCIVCRTKLSSKRKGESLCKACKKQKPVTALTLRTRLNKSEKEVRDLEMVCRSCANLRQDDEIRCDSLACSVFYSRTRHRTALRGVRQLLEPVIRDIEDSVKR